MATKRMYRWRRIVAFGTGVGVLLWGFVKILSNSSTPRTGSFFFNSNPSHWASWITHDPIADLITMILYGFILAWGVSAISGDSTHEFPNDFGDWQWWEPGMYLLAIPTGMGAFGGLMGSAFFGWESGIEAFTIFFLGIFFFTILFMLMGGGYCIYVWLRHPVRNAMESAATTIDSWAANSPKPKKEKKHRIHDFFYGPSDDREEDGS